MYKLLVILFNIRLYARFNVFIIIIIIIVIIIIIIIINIIIITFIL